MDQYHEAVENMKRFVPTITMLEETLNDQSVVHVMQDTMLEGLADTIDDLLKTFDGLAAITPTTPIPLEQKELIDISFVLRDRLTVMADQCRFIRLTRGLITEDGNDN